MPTHWVGGEQGGFKKLPEGQSARLSPGGGGGYLCHLCVTHRRQVSTGSFRSSETGKPSQLLGWPFSNPHVVSTTLFLSPSKGSEYQEANTAQCGKRCRSDTVDRHQARNTCPSVSEPDESGGRATFSEAGLGLLGASGSYECTVVCTKARRMRGFFPSNSDLAMSQTRAGCGLHAKVRQGVGDRAHRKNSVLTPGGHRKHSMRSLMHWPHHLLTQATT